MIHSSRESGDESLSRFLAAVGGASRCGRLVSKDGKPQKNEKRMDEYLDGREIRVTITPADPHGFGDTLSGQGEMPKT